MCGRQACVRLRTDVADSGEVTIALDALAAPREGARPFGLGTLVVRFTRDDKGWTLVGPPAQIAQ
ncbi:hypothetical protein [Actinopolymorpha pittospori]|uniref:Uncharacterized protein n=1 Tax=Actinopolymorpha pittospori TaxID=648752 RepID=A0A927N3D0_9ACTN|nr:hypothetical protein [Actinopolymorpha pittospori]MBE1610223.1 hypothetical protein [Actinopolymorpha pittospori]